MSGHSDLRASDHDRDQIIERLHKASTEGRIAAEELEHRVSQALKARTYGELDATVSDLPSTGRRPAAAPRGRSAAGWAFGVVRANPVLLLLAIPVVAVTLAMLIAATMIWMVLMIVFVVVGGRRSMLPGPWTYARGGVPRPRQYGRGPLPRGPGQRASRSRHWA